MKRIILTEGDIHEIIRKSVKNVLKEAFDRDAFNDAIDYITSGLGFSAWRRKHEDLEPLDAENIFSDAESYCRTVKQNNDRLNVRPDNYGRYPGENLNVLDRKGIESMHAQGAGGSRFRGVKALMAGGMSMNDAMKEYDKASKI